MKLHDDGARRLPAAPRLAELTAPGGTIGGDRDPRLPQRLRLLRRPAQRRQVDADQRAGRHQGGDHLVASRRPRAPWCAASCTGPTPSWSLVDTPGLHRPRTLAGGAAQRPGHGDVVGGRRRRGLLPGRPEGRARRPVPGHGAGEGAADGQVRRGHQDRPRRPRPDRRSTCSTSPRSARRPAPTGPRSCRCPRSPVTRSSCSPTSSSRGCRRGRRSTRRASSPTPPRRRSSPT